MLHRNESRRAQRRAAELGASLAAHIRRLVRRDFGPAATAPDVTALFALGDSGGSDVASERDAYVGESLVIARGERWR